MNSGWEVIKLNDICDEITVGHVGPMINEYIEVGIPFLRSQNIHPYYLDLSSIKFISQNFHEKLKKSALHPGDVVVVRTGYPGTSCIIPKTLPIANCADLVIIKPTARLNGKYLTYIFNSTWGQNSVYGKLVGVAQQHFNVSAAKDMIINLPPIQIQKKIVSILSAYDDLIENNTRRIHFLEEMAQCIYNEWFIHFRFPGYENIKIVDSPMGKLPEGWEIKHVGDISKIYRGKSYKSSELCEEGGLPFINLKCIDRGGGFRIDGIKRYNGQYKESQTVKTNDIIIAVTDMTQERRLVAHVARIPGVIDDKAVISMDLVKIEPIFNVKKEYFYGMFRFSDFSNHVKNFANGANVLHLNPEKIEDFEFILPPKDLRDKYSDIFCSILSLCDNLNLKNSILSDTRDLLLPKLISGEIDVSDLSIDMSILYSD